MNKSRWITLTTTGLLASVIAMQSYALPPPVIETNKTIPGISSMLSMVMPAVVNVTVMGEMRGVVPNSRNSSPQPGAPYPNNNGAPYFRQFTEIGSGVIIDAAKGYIVTNAHVVMDAKVTTVTLSDGRRFKAKLVGADKLSDIALLQIKTDNLVAVPLGDSDALQVGDFVAAIGNPFGLQQTVTSGIVSALHRSDLGIEGYENFIQTDASINPGNSGGALVNLKGELVGINTALIGPVSANVGIGLSIPSNMVREVLNQLIKSGKVERGVLGVMVQDLTPALADAFGIQGKRGALVADVSPGSPADKAGIKSQDVVEKINDTVITSGPQLRNMVGLMPLATKVNIVVRRRDKTINLTATIVSPKALKMATEPALASF
jgi:Do/DeqQ family serine protease